MLKIPCIGLRLVLITLTILVHKLLIVIDGTTSIFFNDNIEDYYLKLYDQNPKPNISMIPTTEKRECRESICSDIFNSSYFQERKLHYIDPNDKIKQEEESIFVESPSTKFTKQFRYKERKISTNQNRSVDDLMFICTVWNVTGDIMDIYYVSREYQYLDKKVRFVLGYSDGREIVVLAAAEQPLHTTH